MQEDMIASIGRARADLLAWLDGVGGDDWSRATVCDPWTVKDVLAHMVEGEINVGRLYRREVGAQGFLDPEEGIARWRALPGVAVRAALWQHGIATQRVLDVMAEQQWRAPIKAFGCRTVGQLVRLHRFDLAVHGRDLTDALGAASLWRDDDVAFLTEFVVRAAPTTLARREAPPEPGLVVRVPSSSRSWTITGGEDGWAVRPEELPASSTATMDAEDLVLLTTGRRRRDACKIELTGDVESGERVLAAWRVV